jgi:glycosyltransferase involved in cell wall biosynthesis
MRCAHGRIVISKVIADLVRDKYRVETDLIPNGVTMGERSTGTEHLRRFGLEPGKYFLQVSRMVPEKRQLDLIRAYASLGESEWNLVLVGGLDDTTFSRQVEQAAEEAGVVLTGYLSGAPLQQIYLHAGGFILPSSHEGLPIALLEALSYGLPVLASDIPANLEVGLGQDCYFRLGDSQELAAGLVRLMQQLRDAAARAERVRRVTHAYDWDRIAEQTLAVYRRILARESSVS